MVSHFSRYMIVLAAVALLAFNSLFVVMETERAVKLRFGRLVESDIAPGLHIKIPLVDKVRKFDARVLTLDAPSESFYTIEKKRLIVDSFAKWRIADVGAYYRSTGGDEDVAQGRLFNRVGNGLRNQFGTRTLHEVVSGQREELMLQIRNELNATVNDTLGVEIIDVRVKRIDLPDEVSDQVYRRMTAEREKEARELRSKGFEASEKIRADAERQSTVIKAEAYRDAEQIRGEGDARATAIYATAYEKDPEFYSFTRSLRAYVDSFSSKSDILVVDPKGDFFRYLIDNKGK